ncbi:MAG: ArsR family transcriptional regulator [Betaproteobacteria bacterium]|nr:ArsR family transcriptional regulator [Betaproteobacteria bacterium]
MSDSTLRDRRLACLAALFFERGYRLPLRALRAKVEEIGYAASLDRIATDCAWLAEQGLLAPKGDAVTLTDRGADIVLGRAEQPGVKRPEPGEIKV